MSPKIRLKATKRTEENEPFLDDVVNPAEVDPSTSVEDEHGNFNDSDIEMSANEVDPAEDSDDLDGLDDLDDDFDLDDMGVGDQAGAVGESGDVPPRGPSPTPSSPPSIHPYGDDMDDMWERDKLVADEEAERRELLALQERDEDSEDEDEEMGSGNEHEEEQRDDDVESGIGSDEEIGSGDVRDRSDDMDSEAGSDEDEEIRRSSSELSPAPESEPEAPRALDCSDFETDSDSDEEEGQGTTLEREPWFPSGPKYPCQYNNWMGECNHQAKMSDGKETNEETLQYIKAKVLTKFGNPDGSLRDIPNRGTSELIDRPNRLILPFAKGAVNARPVPLADDPASLREAKEDSMETPVMIKATGMFAGLTHDQFRDAGYNWYADARREGMESDFVPAGDLEGLEEAVAKLRREREEEEKIAKAECNPYSEVRRKKAQKMADEWAAKEEAAVVAPAPQPQESTLQKAKKSANASTDEVGEPVAPGVRRSSRRVPAKTVEPMAPKPVAPKGSKAAKGPKKAPDAPAAQPHRPQRAAKQKVTLLFRGQASVESGKDLGTQGDERESESSEKSPLRPRRRSATAEDKWAFSAKGSSDTMNDAAIAAVIQENLMEMDEQDAEAGEEDDEYVEDEEDDADVADEGEMAEKSPSGDELKEDVLKVLLQKKETGPLRLMYSEWDLKHSAELRKAQSILCLILYYSQDGTPSGVTYPAAHLAKIDFNDQAAIDALNKWRAKVISNIRADSPATMPGRPYVFPNTTQSPGSHKKCVLLYGEDDNMKAKIDEPSPAVFLITFYDQDGAIQLVVYSILKLGRVELTDSYSVKKSNRWRLQWIYRKTVSRRFGRNNDDEWSLKESDWLIMIVACIMFAHCGEPNVFNRIIWEVLEVAFDAYFKAKANHQIRTLNAPLHLAQTPLDDAPFKAHMPGVQFDRRQRLPSDHIGGIMTVEQLEERATGLFDSHIRHRSVTAAEVAMEANWSKFVRALENNPNTPEPGKNEILDGNFEIMEYIKREKADKVRLAKKKGSEEDDDKVGLEEANGEGEKTTRVNKDRAKKTAGKPKLKASPKKKAPAQKSAAKNDVENAVPAKPKATRKRKASSTSPPQAAKRQTTARAPTLETIPEEDEPTEDEDQVAVSIRLQAQQAERAAAKEGGLALNSAPSSVATSAANPILSRPDGTGSPYTSRTLHPRPAPTEDASPRKSSKKSPSKKGGKK